MIFPTHSWLSSILMGEPLASRYGLLRGKKATRVVGPAYTVQYVPKGTQIPTNKGHYVLTSLYLF
jgi:hypothetical protein